MNYNETHSMGSRLPTLPPLSGRTLCHPSFQSLYTASGSEHHHTQCYNQTSSPIISPAELFYCDPTMSCERRIPNLVSELRVPDSFQLNSPPPLMSPCIAPPIQPDPFRSAPHPATDLGGLSVKINSLHPPVQSRLLVLQLTQEEDQAVTNLLKLRHQVKSDKTIEFHPEPVESNTAGEASKARSHGHEGQAWSETELEAANTLLNGFCSTGENHPNSAEANLQPGLSQGSESLPDCTPNGYAIPKNGGPGCGQILSGSEGDAVFVLLSLADVAV
ncbi:uncharacterized protein LOC117807332 isoform X2 [Xyrichtys novacula]|uniref:Uncharacterized protein LOC117807332 isoform X2 n=1 Tax=Xyrichtys novacula TaxID=13765 RepID=A0AAV1HM06_XYRNO|nr:uncharacterized protein LOC117807332 isoform X2 [Xyrichtys novacula]